MSKGFVEIQEGEGIPDIGDDQIGFAYLPEDRTFSVIMNVKGVAKEVFALSLEEAEGFAKFVFDMVEDDLRSQNPDPSLN